jgi:hypothetical protein
MQPVLAAIPYTTGLFIVVWIGFLLSVVFAKIHFRSMKRREMQRRLAQVEEAYREASASSEATDAEGSAVEAPDAATDQVQVVSRT